MRDTPVWRLIAEQEIRTKLRDKAFLGGFGASVVALVALFVVIAVMSAREDASEVAVVDDDSAQVVRAADSAMESPTGGGDGVRPTTVASAEAAEQAVRDGDADAALLSGDEGYTAVGSDEVDPGLRSALDQAASAATIQRNAERQGVDLDALRSGSTLDVRLLDPDAEQSEARSAVSFVFAIVFFVTAIAFGMMIAQSVVREKESRVVEILAAAVPIRAMLWGKILGSSALAFGQVLVLVAVGAAGMYATGRNELLAGVGPALVAYVPFFVLGFLTLASLWSVAGSLATRQEDLQSTTMPAQMLLMVPYLLSVLGNDTVQTVMSMLPIVSTMTMPGRIAEGQVPVWQVGLAIAVTVVAAVVFVRVGSRLYERTLLQTRRKVSYLEALRSAPE